MRWFLDPGIVFPNPSQAVNLEPLLINTVGSLADRPHAYTEIPNLFLAADYVRTGTDLACMESANEAGRRAANALLDRAECPAPRAAIWPLTEPSIFRRFKEWDRLVFEQGAPHSWRSAAWAAFRQWLPLGGDGHRGRRCRRGPSSAVRIRDNFQRPVKNLPIDSGILLGVAATLRQRYRIGETEVRRRGPARPRAHDRTRYPALFRTLPPNVAPCAAPSMSGRQTNGLSRTAIPRSTSRKNGLREAVADRRVAQHRSPQAAVIRRVTASPVRNVDRDLTGEAAALERVVDAFAGQRVGEPAGVADHIHGTVRRSQPETADRDPEGLHAVETVVARQSLRADVCGRAAGECSGSVPTACRGPRTSGRPSERPSRSPGGRRRNRGTARRSAASRAPSAEC